MTPLFRGGKDMIMTSYQTGPRAGQQIAAARPHDERAQLAEDLARWAGEAAEREHDDTVITGTSYGVPFRHGAHCCARAREDGERNEYEFAMGLTLDHVRRRHAAELADRRVAGLHNAPRGTKGPRS